MQLELGFRGIRKKIEQVSCWLRPDKPRFGLRGRPCSLGSILCLYILEVDYISPSRSNIEIPLRCLIWDRWRHDHSVNAIILSLLAIIHNNYNRKKNHNIITAIGHFTSWSIPWTERHLECGAIPAICGRSGDRLGEGRSTGFGYQQQYKWYQTIKREEIAVSKTSNPAWTRATAAGFIWGEEESCRHCGLGLVIELVLLVPDGLPRGGGFIRNEEPSEKKKRGKRIHKKIK